MMVKDLIDTDIPILRVSDTIGKSLEIMSENFLNQLPVIDNEDNYVALIKEDNLLEFDDFDQIGQRISELNYKPMIVADAHFYSALKVMVDQSLNVLPIVEKDGKLLGMVSQKSLLNQIYVSSGSQLPGAIIVVEVKPDRLSVAEIARICESENALILNLYTNFNNQTELMEVTIKTNKENLDGLVSTFERYNYNVIGIYGVKLNDNDDIHDRYNLLMNYINM